MKDFLKNTSNKLKKKWDKLTTKTSQKVKVKAVQHIMKNGQPRMRQAALRQLISRVPKYKQPHKDLFKLLALSEEIEKEGNEELRECDKLEEIDSQLEKLRDKKSIFTPRHYKSAKLVLMRVGKRSKDLNCDCDSDEVKQLLEKMSDLTESYIEEE